MRIPPLLACLGLTFVLAGCGDHRQGSPADAARHQKAALTYQQQGLFRVAMIEARNAIQQQPQDVSGYVLLAGIYNQVGAYGTAQSLLEDLQEASPEVVLELATAYIASEKYRSGLQLLQEYEPAPEERLRYLTLGARASIALGERERVEKILQQLEGVDDPAFAHQALYLRAASALAQGQHDTAESTLATLLLASPEHLDGLILAGEIALYRNQLTLAEHHLTRALTLVQSGDLMTVDRARVLEHLTQVLIQQGRSSEAYTYQRLLADANPEGYAVQQQFADALELYQQGKLQDAERLLQELHDRFPQDKNAGTLLGLVQYQQGDDEQALALFDQYLDPETADSSIIQAAAVAHYRTNRADEALALLKTAVDSQPRDATLLATYGLALLDRDPGSQEASLVLEKSLAINPEQVRLRIALAKRLLFLKKEELALAQLEKAYRQQPQDFLVLQTYMGVLLDTGHDAEARAVWQDLRQEDVDSARSFFLEGRYLLHKADYVSAQAAFQRALTSQDATERAMAYMGLAQSYELNGQLPEAAGVWQTALRENPSLVAGYARWLAIMHKMDKVDEAFTYLLELEKQPRHWQPSVVLAQLYFNQQQLPLAIQHAETALARSQGLELVRQVAANLYHHHGLLLKAQGEFPEARTRLLKALELNPDNILYLANLIDLELNARNLDEAQKLLDQYPQTGDNRAAYLFLQASILRVGNKPEAALSLYRQSWDLRPSDNAGEVLYAIYRHAGNSESAQDFLRQWQQALPQSYRALMFLALDAQQQNRTPDAIAYYEQVLDIAPDLAAAANNLAWLYHEQQDPRALETARQAYERAPGSAEVLDTYGWILVEQGHHEEGIGYLERAAALAPDNREIRQHLEQARAKRR